MDNQGGNYKTRPTLMKENNNDVNTMYRTIKGIYAYINNPVTIFIK